MLPADPGDYIAQLRETMNVQGLITGADISEDGVVGLLGYNFSGVNIVWLCFDYQGANFFSGNKRKISLGLALNNSQTEAIAFRQGGYGYISSEQFASLDAKLLSFDSGQWTNGLSTSLNELEEENPFKVFPNPFSKNVSILFVKDEKFDISLYDVSGELILQRIQSSGRLLRIEDLNLKEGFYFLKISNNNNVWLEKLVLQK